MIFHGHDGWTLLDYEWDPATGVATCRYERVILGLPENRVVEIAQPSSPSHVGWGSRANVPPLPAFRQLRLN